MECEFSVDNLGQSIAIKRFGCSSKPAILAIHGWLDNANSFLPLAQHLKDFCIYAIDLPGHGLSDHLPSCANYHFIDGVTLINQLVDLLFEKPPHLLGHSLGACLCSIAGPTLHKKIEKIVLLDALGPLINEDDKAYSQYQSFISKKNKLNAQTRLPVYETLEQAARHRAKAGYLDLKDAETLCARGLKKQNNGFVFAHDRKLLLPSAIMMTQSMVMNFLSELQQPCLFLQAKDGFAFDKSALNERLKVVPHLQHKLISGGHHFHMEKPKLTAKQIKLFLN